MLFSRFSGLRVWQCMYMWVVRDVACFVDIRQDVMWLGM